MILDRLLDPIAGPVLMEDSAAVAIHDVHGQMAGSPIARLDLGGYRRGRAHGASPEPEDSGRTPRAFVRRKRMASSTRSTSIGDIRPVGDHPADRRLEGAEELIHPGDLDGCIHQADQVLAHRHAIGLERSVRPNAGRPQIPDRPLDREEFDPAAGDRPGSLPQHASNVRQLERHRPQLLGTCPSR